MKTQEELQAIVNQLREVCNLHGVVLLPAPDQEAGGFEILLMESKDIAQLDPHCLYFGGEVSPEKLALTNKVIDQSHRLDGSDKALDRFAIKGIGDVLGHTKPRIVVSEYHEADNDLFKGAENAVDVESLSEVEDILFVKNARLELGFTHFSIELSHGPFGVLVAHYQDSRPLTIGFIEGAPEEDLKKQWPPQETTHGSV